MLSRIRKSPSRKSKNVSATDGVGSLIGGSGVSLDGESLMLPKDGDPRPDDVSSVNTSNYGGNNWPIRSFDVVNGDEPSLLGDEPSITAGVPAPQSSLPPEEVPKEVKTNSSDDDSDGGGWVPGFLRGAPTYLKVIIVVSVALLMGAVVLVIVAAILASNDSNDSSSKSSSQTEGIGDLTFPPSPPTEGPTSLPPTETPVVPTEAPSTASPTTTPYPTFSPAPTSPPTLTPSFSPSGEETLTPTFSPSQTFSPNETLSPSLTTEAGGETTSGGPDEIVFYVTAGRFQGTNLQELPARLRSLPTNGNTSFMTHLGDWNSPFATACDRASYQTAAWLYSNSSVPVYFVPGDNEYNDCPDPEAAKTLWDEFFLRYSTEWWAPSKYFTVNREEGGSNPENYAFVYSEILFVGINLVGGQVHDEDEWNNRMDANLAWIDTSVNDSANVKVLVVFAHADPDITATGRFFEGFEERVENDYSDLHVAFIHRNLGVETSGIEYETDSFIYVVVEGQIWPPSRVKINTAAGDFDFGNKKTFDVNQDDWYEEEVGGAAP